MSGFGAHTLRAQSWPTLAGTFIGFVIPCQVKIMGQSAGGSLPGVGVMGGGVESVTCGMFATMALVKPWNDPHDVENAYKRAVQADSESAEVLRQLDTFVPYYDKYVSYYGFVEDCKCRHH